MICMARSFGAPVIDPPGNVAASSPGQSAGSRSRPSTHDTRWCTSLNARGSHRRVTRTLPVSHTRPRSLRSRSTIITCSARSFGELSSSLRSWASAAGVAPRGRVPLIGQVSTRSPATRRKHSGEAERIARPGVSR